MNALRRLVEQVALLLTIFILKKNTEWLYLIYLRSHFTDLLCII